MGLWQFLSTMVHTDLLWLKTIALFIPNLEQVYREDVLQRPIVKDVIYTFSSGETHNKKKLWFTIFAAYREKNMANLQLAMGVQKFKPFQLRGGFAPLTRCSALVSVNRTSLSRHVSQSFSVPRHVTCRVVYKRASTCLSLFFFLLMCVLVGT